MLNESERAQCTVDNLRQPEMSMSQIKSLVTPQRKTVQAQVDEEEECFDHDISVVTYNILADFYLQSALAKGLYKNCSRENVTPNHGKDSPRHRLILREVRTIYYSQVLQYFLPITAFLDVWKMKSAEKLASFRIPFVFMT